MSPDIRITVRPDLVVRAVHWTPHLVSFGPLTTLLEGRERAGVTIADVTFVREDDDDPDGEIAEAIVQVLCGGDDGALDAILDWATLVGHRRVWLPDGVHDLAPVEPGRAEARCGGCRVRLVDGLPAFWAWVRRAGHFPMSCPLCGADLPQWRPVTPRRTTAGRPRRDDARPTARRSRAGRRA